MTTRRTRTGTRRRERTRTGERERGWVVVVEEEEQREGEEVEVECWTDNSCQQLPHHGGIGIEANGNCITAIKIVEPSLF